MNCGIILLFLLLCGRNGCGSTDCGCDRPTPQPCRPREKECECEKERECDDSHFEPRFDAKPFSDVCGCNNK